MINGVDPRIVDRLSGVAGVKVHNLPGSGHSIFVMHCDTEPFKNTDLRMALKPATNRTEMDEYALARCWLEP
jgi:peptide/nickel transport system substrate-binding protein